MRQVWSLPACVGEETRSLIEDFVLGRSELSVAEYSGGNSNLPSKPQRPRADSNSNQHDALKDGFRLLRLTIDLGWLKSNPNDLTLRTPEGKRKAQERFLQRVSKIARHSNQGPHRNTNEPRDNSIQRENYECQLLQSLPIQVKRTMPNEQSTASKEMIDDGIDSASTIHLNLKDLRNKHLCNIAVKPSSEDEERILLAMVRLLKPDKNSPCKTTAVLALQNLYEAQQFFLQLDLLWENSWSFDRALKISSSSLRQDILYFASLLATPTQGALDKGSAPRVFYESVYTPPRGSKSSGQVEIPGLRTGLYAFQERSLKWLLQREKAGEDTSKPSGGYDNEAFNGFVPVTDLTGRLCFFNAWLQICTSHSCLISKASDHLKGGILAEEMGLGKTVEILSLIQLNKRPMVDVGLQDGLHRTPATLIIAPKSIVSQWKEEIDTHAPGLEVMIYGGMKTHGGKNQLGSNELIELINAHDIILVTYEVLSKELWYAIDPPERSRRHSRVYERKKSPLVQLHWWRVVLDEAQMVESGVTNAAKVAVQLPRQNAWAVTGTPLKKDSNDLFGLLTFLRLVPFCLSSSLWAVLLRSYTPVFKELVHSICLRHSKDQVRAELQLPPQKRVIISLPFTAVEEENYSQLFEEMTNDCGFDPCGMPQPNLQSSESSKIVSAMRSWLVRLRQICLHPEVGDRNRKALGRREGAPLRTVADVLQVMFEQNETLLRTEERARLQSMLRRGQILEHAKQPQAAMTIWQEVEKEATENVLTDRKSVAEAEVDCNPNLASIAGSDEDQDNSNTSRISRLKNRLRISLEVKHTATFFIANAIYQIKTNENAIAPGSEAFRRLDEQETTKYEEAKHLRRELLASASEKTKTFRNQLVTKVSGKDLVKIPRMKEVPFAGGVETRKYIENIEELVSLMNTQADLLDEWRGKLIKAASAPLVDQEETELTGEEYEKSTKDEDKIHAYLEAIRLLVADRSQALTGQKNTYVRREASNILRQAFSGEGHAPELMKILLTECNKLRLGESQDGDVEICLRGLIAQLTQHRGVLDFTSNKATSKQAEKTIVENILRYVRTEASEQQKTISFLERELDLFSDTVNARVEYYKQLQGISDLVAPYEENLTNSEREARLRFMESSELQFQRRVNKLRSRATYLEHLKADSLADSVERKCIICQDTFETGCLTSCGHVFCKDCIMLWWRQHRTCPTCKASISRTDLIPITYKPIEVSIHEQNQGNVPMRESTAKDSPSDKAVIYSGIRQKDLDDIKAIDLRGSFGTKIDMLARHIVWIREHDPGAKSIVFSQFRDFLEVLEHAFSRFGIGWSSIDSGPVGVERFRKDSGVECLLLHAKAQASGLNLVNATHVFICEPLINTAIELQAIARVHRIGQHSPTTVWMYLVDDTVEKAIYEISAERRLAHIKASSTSTSKVDKRLSNGLYKEANLEDEIDAANSLEMEQALPAKLLAGGRSGGEQVAKEDLWPSLFKYRPNLSDSGIPEEAEHATATTLAYEAAANQGNRST